MDHIAIELKILNPIIRTDLPDNECLPEYNSHNAHHSWNKGFASAVSTTAIHEPSRWSFIFWLLFNQEAFKKEKDIGDLLRPIDLNRGSNLRNASDIDNSFDDIIHECYFSFFPVEILNTENCFKIAVALCFLEQFVSFKEGLVLWPVSDHVLLWIFEADSVK